MLAHMVVFPALLAGFLGPLCGEVGLEALVPDCEPQDILIDLRCYVLCLQGKSCDPAPPAVTMASPPNAARSEEA